MIQIRRNVFETNSSSTHTITIITEEEYNDWSSGKLLYDRWDGEFIPADSVTDEERENREELCSLNEWFRHYEGRGMETSCVHHTTKSGDKIVVFGYGGYDG